MKDTENSKLRALEKRKLAELARKYRSQGYEVIVEPSGSQLPPFLKNYAPDMIARGPSDNVVVQVHTQTSLFVDETLPKLAEQIQSEPTWRFDLVVTNPRHAEAPPLADSPKSGAPPQIADRLRRARRFATKDPEASLLLTWACLEGIVRSILQEEKITAHQYTPVRAIKTLYSLGFFSKQQLDSLLQSFALRSQLVHGSTVKVSAHDAERAHHLAEDLLEARHGRLTSG